MSVSNYGSLKKIEEDVLVRRRWDFVHEVLEHSTFKEKGGIKKKLSGRKGLEGVKSPG